MAHEGITVDMAPSHPGDFIRTEVTEELGRDASSRDSGRPPGNALGLIEKAFGLSMDMLLRMQAWYDAVQMRTRAAEVRRYEPA